MGLQTKHRESGEILSAIRTATGDQKPLFELSHEQREAIQTAAGVALAIIAVVGVVTVTAVAPNIFQAVWKIRRLGRGKKYTFKEKQLKTAQTFYYLKRRGLIEITSETKGLVARLTKKGRGKMEELNLQTLRVKTSKKWDGKWWVVAADIPTHDYRWAADLFRKKVKQIGFYPLQKTLWFYPYNPIKEIEYVANYFGIGQFVTAMEVSRIDKDDERKLKKFFEF